MMGRWTTYFGRMDSPRHPVGYDSKADTSKIREGVSFHSYLQCLIVKVVQVRLTRKASNIVSLLILDIRVLSHI